MIHDESVICETRKWPWETYLGDMDIDLKLMQKNVRKFIAYKRKARVLTLDEVKGRNTAFFEIGHTDPEELITISLSNIMTEYKIRNGKLIAMKVWEFKGKKTVERFAFPLENYGKTWRCWSAVPGANQIRTVKW